MTIAKEILATMDLFDEKLLRFDAEFIDAYLRKPLKSLMKGKPDPKSLFKVNMFLKRLASESINSQMRPNLVSVVQGDDIYENTLKDTSIDWVENYFIRAALHEIPNCILRARQLIKLNVKYPPGSKIEHYFEQACRCYIYGLNDAVAIMSRAVIEFSLKEMISYYKKDTSGHASSGHIEDLINTGIFYKLIKKDNIYISHRIRKVGNKAIHNSSISDTEARQSIRDSVKLLSNIYEKYPW